MREHVLAVAQDDRRRHRRAADRIAATTASNSPARKPDRRRQAQRIAVQPVRDVAAVGALAAMRGRAVHRLPERARLDVRIGEAPQQRAARHAEPFLVDEHGVEPERAERPARLAHRRDAGDVREELGVARGVGALDRDELVEHLELRDPDRGLHVGEAVVVADFAVHVLDRVVLRLGGEIARAVRERGVGGDDRPAAAGRDELVAVEAQARRVRARPRGPVLVARAEALRRVFDHGEAVRAGSGEDRIEVDGMAEDVDRHDRAHAPARALVAHGRAVAFAFLGEKPRDGERVHLPRRRAPRR